MSRRSTGAYLTQNLREMPLRSNKITPGELVFTDQYQPSVLGRRWGTFGRENNKD